MENRLLQSPQNEASDSSTGKESLLTSADYEISTASALSENLAVPGESEAFGQDSGNGQTALSAPSTDEEHQISDSAADENQPPALSDDEFLADNSWTDESLADEPLTGESQADELQTGGSPDTDTSHKHRKKKKSRASKAPQTFLPVSMGCWFVTLMCMNIPVIGWIYLLILACSRSAGARRSFAKAYLLYKFIFLLITLAILAVAVHYGLEIMDKVLAYMEML